MKTEVRELPGFDGKYWLDDKARVWRKDAGGTLYKCALYGVPRRVRLYRFGKETRRYVHCLFEEVWPENQGLIEKSRGGPGGG